MTSHDLRVNHPSDAIEKTSRRWRGRRPARAPSRERGAQEPEPHAVRAPRGERHQAGDLHHEGPQLGVEALRPVSQLVGDFIVEELVADHVLPKSHDREGHVEGAPRAGGRFERPEVHRDAVLVRLVQRVLVRVRDHDGEEDGL